MSDNNTVAVPGAGAAAPDPGTCRRYSFSATPAYRDALARAGDEVVSDGVRRVIHALAAFTKVFGGDPADESHARGRAIVRAIKEDVLSSGGDMSAVNAALALLTAASAVGEPLIPLLEDHQAKAAGGPL